MNYFKRADDVAKELAKVLIHNKYLLEEETLLQAVIYARVLPCLGEVFDEGKESIIINDLTGMIENIPAGAN